MGFYENMNEIKGERIYTTMPILTTENNIPTNNLHSAIASLIPQSTNTTKSQINYVSEKYNDDCDYSDDNEYEKSQRLAAGCFGGTIGCFVGGPILALIAGFGTAYLTKKDDILGDTSRAAGDIALLAKEKFDELSEKHCEKSKKHSSYNTTIDLNFMQT